MIEFDESTHIYRLKGKIVPGVTSIIKRLCPDFKFVDDDVLERAQEFGKAVHKVCELYDRDDLDESSIDLPLIPYLDAWKKFKRECDFVVMLNEQIVFSELYRYAGTLDRIGVMQGRVAIVDIKSSAALHPGTGAQIAGYEFAAIEMGLISKRQRPIRCAVQLNYDGAYKVRPYENYADLSAFLACNTIKQWSDLNAIRN